jgi:hypothetical protein
MTENDPAATPSAEQLQVPPATTAEQAEYAPAKTVTVAPVSPVPLYRASATATCAPLLGAVTTGASGAVTSKAIVTGVLEFDDEGLLNADF